MSLMCIDAPLPNNKFVSQLVANMVLKLYLVGGHKFNPYCIFISLIY